MGAEGIPIVGGLAQVASIEAETSATTKALWKEADAQRKNAEIAREAGQFNASRQQEDANQYFGTISADVGASGTTQDSGNILDILRQSHANAELDRLTILHGAELEAISSTNRAAGLMAEAESNKKIAGYRQLSAFLGGAAGAVSQRQGQSNVGDGSPRLRQTSSSGSRRGDY